MFENISHCIYLAGITLANSVRRRPNAFNLLHQMEVMLRGGYTGDTAVAGLEVGNWII